MGRAHPELQIVAGYPGVIDVAITDLALPKMSGVELASRLRRLKPGLKVIYRSGYAAFVLDRQGIIDAPLVEKPFKADDLLRTLREVCDGLGRRPG